MMTTPEEYPSNNTKSDGWRAWISVILLVLILVGGAYLRLVGLDWDENQHLHPDERFLTMVEAALQPIGTPEEFLGTPPNSSNQTWRANYVDELPDCNAWGGYFDTACSPLNPNNRGYDFYVYGTLPIFIVRYVAEWLAQTGYGEVYLVGRMLSALSDLLVIVLVYMMAVRIYNRRVGLLAAAFTATSVLLIQQSHFFTVDTFTNFFIFLALFSAVWIATTHPQENSTANEGAASLTEESQVRVISVGARWKQVLREFTQHALFWPSLMFGLALGMAVASKINAAPLAVTLPGAALVYLSRLSPSERGRQWPRVLAYMVLAGFVSLFAFRIFQPYAFTGPGFFGLKPNRAWLDDLSALRAQTSGDVDFPPALQWARRPIWFSLQNMVTWGLGLPLGLLAWAGFLWMGWRIVKGPWRKHILLWAWVAAYFLWQSLQWNSTMRYQLPIYPLLALFAAWLVFDLWDRARDSRSGRVTPGRILVIGVGSIVLVLTLLWAVAFSRIYTQPHTRVAATRWLFQNMPASINLDVQTDTGIKTQPLAYPQDLILLPGDPHDLRFTSRMEGQLTNITLAHVVDRKATSALSFQLTLTSLFDPGVTNQEVISLEEIQAGGGEPTSYDFSDPGAIRQGETYDLTISTLDGYHDFQVCGPLIMNLLTIQGVQSHELPGSNTCLGRADLPHHFQFHAEVDGILQDVEMLIQVEELQPNRGEQNLNLELRQDDSQILTSGNLVSDFSPGVGGRGQNVVLPVAQGISLHKDQVYILRLTLQDGDGAIQISPSAPANESSWDDGLPLRMDGYDPYGGIYSGGLNFEMYWDDNQEKYERFVSVLDQADYLLITSSRQWGSTTRVPERYPLTSEYYQRLLGCPTDRSIEWCYNVAQPGRFQGELGFDLIQVFQSNPNLAGFEINDQFAEEAFTVYDHPKVFIFKKSAEYDPERIRQILGAVDLTKVIRITPKQADSYPGNLMLPADRLAEQQAGGTWSDYFNPQNWQNRFQILGVFLWYASVSLVGWMVYPWVRMALPGLSDRGYPFARIAGLLLLSVLVWLAGSVRIPFSRLTISLALGFLLIFGGVLGFLQRDALGREWREKRGYFLRVEALFLLFFIAGLLVRYGNPDLWHPWKGGEKPMDFSYFNAVLKSTTFPPYDPWFAGGYINYYYYGFVLVGVLVKFLGLVPAFAYNLILPTLFSLTAMGAFSVVWNLVNRKGPGSAGQVRSFLAAGSGALALAVLGNLGILQMFAQGLQRNAAPGGDIQGAGAITKLVWTVSGFFKTIAGAPIPIRMDEWYWNPSRVIAFEHGSPITEFPYFTFLYADLHAHLIALPIALLAIVWTISIVQGGAWARPGGRRWVQVASGLLLGGLAIGALYPINLSDIYTYLPLGGIALLYGFLKTGQSGFRGHGKNQWLMKPLLATGLCVLGLFALTRLFYQPYIHWYGQGYSQIRIWDGTHTPLSEYLTHWGFFLFILVSWMAYESLDWMAVTPVSAISKLRPYQGLIWSALVGLAILILVLGINLYPEGLPAESIPIGLGVHIAWVVLPLAAWSGILILRPGLSDEKRMVLFFLGTGLVLTLMVEVIVVSGDIGRMNTVFKFYLQAWTLFAVGAAAAFNWLLKSLPKWSPGWRGGWYLVFGALFFITLLYPLLGSFAKILDRMEISAPHTLDGMAYMQYATYHDEGAAMNLSQDYNAIRWMQDNVRGSPVIVEANSVEYHWGTRYTVYTGLPGVVGWNWHQRQQRTVTSHDWVFERVDAVHQFYQTQDLAWVRDFLGKYGVRYIVLGQLEQAKYAGPGLDKFEAQDGLMWREVFRDRQTAIYEVIHE